MIFNLIKHAKQLLFDDSKAKTGSANVQGAIEATKTKVDDVEGSVGRLQDGQICYEVGDSYMGVNSSGKIVEITVDEISGRVNTVSTKKAVQSHDDVLSNFVPEFIQESGSTMSISNGTITKTNSITLTKGLWYVNANVRWEKGSATGIRNICLHSNESTSFSTAFATNETDLLRLTDTMPGLATNSVTQIAKGLLRVKQTTTFHLLVSQNSGGDIDAAYNSIGAYKIRNDVV